MAHLLTLFGQKVNLEILFSRSQETEKMDELNSHQKNEVTDSKYYVRRLHEVPELVNECCDLINKEWKRSHTARLRSIESSCESFPMSLVLLKKDKKPEIVGHCRISKLFKSNNKVFVETVVIHPNLRGKGLGTVLMKEVENVCKSKNIEQIYLSTRGQEGFYGKLGYTEMPDSHYLSQFNISDDVTSQPTEKATPVLDSFINKNSNAPGPPPPPLPKVSLNSEPKKTFMKKNLL